MIKVSDSAKSKVSSLMKDDGFDPLVDFVRVGVKSGGCSGLSYEFLIAKTGERAFPQNKVIAGRVQYIESDWVWRQAIDDSEETQSFPLSSIVTFVYKDDEKFNGYTPPPPPIIFNVPYDVFYPFEIENAAPSTTYPSLSLSISLSISISIALVLNWN